MEHDDMTWPGVSKMAQIDPLEFLLGGPLRPKGSLVGISHSCRVEKDQLAAESGAFDRGGDTTEFHLSQTGIESMR